MSLSAFNRSFNSPVLIAVGFLYSPIRKTTRICAPPYSLTEPHVSRIMSLFSPFSRAELTINNRNTFLEQTSALFSERLYLCLCTSGSIKDLASASYTYNIWLSDRYCVNMVSTAAVIQRETAIPTTFSRERILVAIPEKKRK